MASQQLLLGYLYRRLVCILRLKNLYIPTQTVDRILIREPGPLFHPNQRQEKKIPRFSISGLVIVRQAKPVRGTQRIQVMFSTFGVP
jgi:hypothetical protein